MALKPVFDEKDWANAAELFYDIFRRNPFADIKRIKSEIELVGYTRWRTWTIRVLNNFPVNNQEEEQIFRNAIFLVYAELTLNNHTEALELLLSLFRFWVEFCGGNFSKFETTSILHLNDLLSECIHYALVGFSDEIGFDAQNPFYTQDDVNTLQEIIWARSSTFTEMQSRFDTNILFFWQAEWAIHSENCIETVFGQNVNWRLLPNFGRNRLQKCLYFIIELCNSKELPNVEMAKKLKTEFFDKELIELEETSNGTVCEEDAWGEPYVFNSVDSLMEIAINRYRSNLEEAVGEDFTKKLVKII